ncbi:CAP domain-containing protein [Deinococcus aquaedulcis]|uniref:CAP domain-containing protein n=1 Tax=Deinococcus aquaedulcis TaxID=2840455 RepID=UPI001F3F7F24|nr:CAP domain-containing protein [Deinococcus aquaedulcis]
MLNVTPRRLLGTLATLAALATPATAQTTAESQLVARLNQVRAQGVSCPGSGVRPVAGGLTYTPALAAAARQQAAYMSSTGRISHTGAGGSTPRVRAASTGVNAVSVTEIIFMGGGVNPESAIRWWLNSAVHCFWMNERRYTHVGAAVVPGSRGTAYVMVLSSQPR